MSEAHLPSLRGPAFVPSNLVLEAVSLHRRSFTSFAGGEYGFLLCKTGNHLRGPFPLCDFLPGNHRPGIKSPGRKSRETERMIAKGSTKTKSSSTLINLTAPHKKILLAERKRWDGWGGGREGWEGG